MSYPYKLPSGRVIIFDDEPDFTGVPEEEMVFLELLADELEKQGQSSPTRKVGDWTLGTCNVEKAVQRVLNNISAASSSNTPPENPG